jgi:hypothetical protein
LPRYPEDVVHKDSFWLPLFHVVLTSGTLIAFVGLGAGALIGFALNNVGAGAGIGLAVGVVAGLFLSVYLARQMGRHFATPPTPPPGGWRRWDDDED